MYKHPDPTANQATGAAEREWRRMVLLAIRCRTKQTELPKELFTGIFSRLLTDSLEDLQKALKKVD